MASSSIRGESTLAHWQRKGCFPGSGRPIELTEAAAAIIYWMDRDVGGVPMPPIFIDNKTRRGQAVVIRSTVRRKKENKEQKCLFGKK